VPGVFASNEEINGGMSTLVRARFRCILLRTPCFVFHWWNYWWYEKRTATWRNRMVCSISVQAFAWVSSNSSTVIQLHAKLHGHEILILVDSGSSTSFVKKQLADRLSRVVPLTFMLQGHCNDYINVPLSPPLICWTFARKELWIIWCLFIP
jgi:hypothetical protein